MERGRVKLNTLQYDGAVPLQPVNILLDMYTNVSRNKSATTADLFVTQFEFQTTVSVICGILLSINFFAWFILQQTTRIPNLNKFLASAILLFHVSSNVFLIMEKVSSFWDVYTPSIFRSLAITCIANNPPTVAFMSIERLWALSSLRLYFKYHQSNIIKCIPMVVWTFVGVSILLVTQRICPLNTTTLLPVCDHYFRLGIPVAVSFWSAIAFICYIKIYTIILRTSKVGPVGWTRPKHVFAGRRSTTGVVFAFQITNVISLILVLVAGWIHKGPIVEKTIICSNLIEIFNAAIDPFLYVFWFQECRYILMKRLLFFFPGMKRNVEKLRISVYNIVTAPRVANITV